MLLPLDHNMSTPIFSQENDYVIARPSIIETLQFDGTCELQDGKKDSVESWAK